MTLAAPREVADPGRMPSGRARELRAPRPFLPRRARRRRGMARLALLSVLLHLLLFALFIGASRLRILRQNEPLPPPAVAMVFQSGSPLGPAVPNPEREARLPAPVPPSPPPPPREAVPRPSTPPPQEAAPQSTPAPVPREQAAPPPSLPPIAPPLAEALPLPPPLPPQPAPPKPQPEPRIAALPQPLLRPVPPRPQTRPLPLTFGPSFRLPPSLDPTVTAREPSQLAMGAGRRGPLFLAPKTDISTEAAGSDWRNEYHLWLVQHSYYPDEAARNGEQGAVTVHLVVQHDGTVESVRLVHSSGYHSLDHAIEDLFTGARLPSLPEGSGPQEFEINQTIDYIIERERG